MFSILSSAYRTESQVAGMIESVLAQTSADWELIVVDNGRSEEMAAVVEPYTADPRIRLLRQENGGISGGVNAAAAVARGRWYVVLHSDDHLVPSYCARMAEVLDAHPEIDALCCDAFMRVVATGAILHRSFRRLLAPWAPTPRGEQPVALADVLAGRPLYYVAAFRAEAWHATGGYRSDPPNIEDRRLILDLLRLGYSVHEIPDRLSVYMMEDGSATFEPTRARQMQASLERVSREAALASGRAEDLAALDVGIRRSRYVRALAHARIAFSRGDLPAARSEVATAWRQRRTVRAGALLAGLRIAPGLLRRVHPAKRRFGERLGVLGARVARRVGPVVPAGRRLVRAGRQ